MVTTIKSLLKRNKCINNLYVKYKWRRRKVSYGSENKDKVFYVIRRAPNRVGLFSYVTIVMGHIKYAVEQGYIPVVDMQTIENTYLEKEQIGKCNAWEFYFEQPCGYSLEDIKRSKRIILSNGLLPREFPEMKMVQDSENYDMWKGYCNSYLHILPDVQKSISEKYENMFGEARVLGVLCRGTDYTNRKPPEHPVQPDISTIIEKANEEMQKHNCEFVYLATEDEAVYRQFKQVFGEKMKSTNQKRYEETGTANINDLMEQSESDRYLRGLEYLVTIGVLARCNCLVAGCAGGTYGAMMLTKGYEEQYVFWLGCYPSKK